MEKELKFALTLREYAKLCAFASGPERQQTNIYFDDKAFSLRQQGGGLRLRLEGKRAVFTLKKDTQKTPFGIKQGWHERLEWEFPLKRRPLDDLKRQRFPKKPPLRLSALLKKQFSGIVLERLRPIGAIHTLRRCVPFEGFVGDLDCWQVGRAIYYEFEVEAKDLGKAQSALKRLFKALKIALRPRKTTKLAGLFRQAAQKTKARPASKKRKRAL